MRNARATGGLTAGFLEQRLRIEGPLVTFASLATEFQGNNIVILSEWVDMVLIRNCKRHSSPQSLALTSHHTLNNRKNTGTRLPAFFLQSDVHTAGK
jgi:hypothetical protein